MPPHITRGTRGFFSRAAGRFGVVRKPKSRAGRPREKTARININASSKPETAQEKALAPRVG